MILTDREIRDIPYLITPFTEQVKEKGFTRGLSPCGYDLALGNKFIKYHGYTVDPTKKFADGQYVVSDFSNNPKIDYYILGSCDFVLGQSVEYIKMPTNLHGMCHLKSTWVRTGLMMSPTLIQPGWEGYLTFEFVNGTRNPITLHFGVGIVHLSFTRINEPGKSYSGIYQNQASVTPPKTD